MARPAGTGGRLSRGRRLDRTRLRLAGGGESWGHRRWFGQGQLRRLLDPRRTVSLDRPRHRIDLRRHRGIGFDRIALRELGFGFSQALTFQGGVDLIAEQAAGLVAPLARLLQRHFGIGPEGEPLLLAAEAILHPPRLETRSRHEQVQAVRVGQLIIFIAGLRRACLTVGKHGAPSPTSPCPRIAPATYPKCPDSLKRDDDARRQVFVRRHDDYALADVERDYTRCGGPGRTRTRNLAVMSGQL